MARLPKAVLLRILAGIALTEQGQTVLEVEAKHVEAYRREEEKAAIRRAQEAVDRRRDRMIARLERYAQAEGRA